MNRLDIDKDRCKACCLCTDACPRKLLDLSDELNSKGYHPVVIREMEKCTACALCAQVCPEGCITVFKEVKKKTSG